MTTFPSIASTVKNYNYAENAFLPREVTIPIVQEKKEKCIPIVSEGDTVAEGQVIAISQSDQYCAKLHSPVPGTVIGLSSVVCPNGRPEVAVKIQMKGRFSFTGKKDLEFNWENLSPHALLEKIADRGVINTYYVSNTESLAKQINEVSKQNKKYLVVRLFDEDPVRVTDSLVTKLYFEEVRKGAFITAKALDAEGIVYVYSDEMNKREQIAEKIVLDRNEKIFVVNTKKYPAGFKKEICTAYKKTFKKESDFSISENDLFVDSSTMYEVYQAIEHNVPVISKLVHFSGNCLSVSCILNVKIGVLLRDVVNQLGGFEKEPSLIVINGHLTGYSVQSLDFPITKYVKSIAFLSKNKAPDQLMYSCISCGNCRSVCPRNLSPDLLYMYKAENKPLSQEYIKSTTLCAECGLCNTVCPARIPLSQIIASIKSTELETNRE